ncbi:MAG: Ig-like domain-containing protein, partial [Gaiellaceae bacterium]
SVALAGGGTGGGYANAANVASVGVSFTLGGAGAVATDQIAVTLSDGSGHTASRTVSGYGAGPVSVGGFDLSAFAQGSFSISVVSTDAAGNVSATGTGSGTKDTVAPALSATYVDNKGADAITGTTEAGRTVTITETAPSPGSFSGTAAGNGSFSISVDNVKGKTVAYTVSVTDAAGNTATVPINQNDTK